MKFSEIGKQIRTMLEIDFLELVESKSAACSMESASIALPSWMRTELNNLSR